MITEFTVTLGAYIRAYTTYTVKADNVENAITAAKEYAQKNDLDYSNAEEPDYSNAIQPSICDIMGPSGEDILGEPVDFAFNDKDKLEYAAQDMYNTLKHVQSWLWLSLLHPDKPVCRESAAKALEEINGVLNNGIE
jgi:hypothetical protein